MKLGFVKTAKHLVPFLYPPPQKKKNDTVIQNAYIDEARGKTKAWNNNSTSKIQMSKIVPVSVQKIHLNLFSFFLSGVVSSIVTSLFCFLCRNKPGQFGAFLLMSTFKCLH